MTLEQIRGMSDDEISNQVCINLMVERGNAPIKHYATDLNTAMRLVPQGDEWDPDFDDCLRRVMSQTTPDCWWYWAVVCLSKPRALCEAYLLWKAGDK